MISIRHLHKRYLLDNGRSHIVFDDASVELPGGQNIALLGPNGAGKTTLLRLLAGVEKPDRGEIRADARLSWPVALKGSLLDTMTARENCRLVLAIHGYTHGTVREKLASIRQLSGLGKFFDQPVEKFSSGMKARLRFALCMAFDYDVFLLDEITSVGDAEFREICQRWLRAREHPHNIILVSHDMAVVREFCQSALIINRGKLHFEPNLDAATAAFSAA